MKTCSKCGTEINKNLEVWRKCSTTSNTYLSHTCKKCHIKNSRKTYKKHRSKRLKSMRQYYREHKSDRLEYAKKYRTKHPDRCKNTQLKKIYDITLVEYTDILKNQNGGCAICHRKTPGRWDRKYLVVDHNHKTGKVRGLLCDPCNKALGHFKDKIENLRNAQTYLEKHI